MMFHREVRAAAVQFALEMLGIARKYAHQYPSVRLEPVSERGLRMSAFVSKYALECP